MIDTVIFDMDGVIIDSEPLHMAAEQEIFSTIGINISPERHSTFVGTSSRNMWEMIIRDHSLSTPIDDLLEQNKAAYRKRLAVATGAAVPGVTELIRSLHATGFKLAVASSSVTEDIETVLAMYSLRKYFRVIVSGANVQFSKPHPEIFLKTAALLESAPAQCLVIEDSENGVRAAKAAGMKCIGFQNINSGNQRLTLADKVVDSIGEISVEFIRTDRW